MAEEESIGSSKATKMTAFLAGLWTGAIVALFSAIEPYLIGATTRTIGYAILSIVACAPAYRYAFGDFPDRSGSATERFLASLRFIGSNAKLGLMWIFGAGLFSFAVTVIGDLVG
jgi:hypothetical protein